MCRCDGIGRRAGLKIPWWQHRVGSTPTTGTIQKIKGVISFDSSLNFFINMARKVLFSINELIYNKLDNIYQACFLILYSIFVVTEVSMNF